MLNHIIVGGVHACDHATLRPLRRRAGWSEFAILGRPSRYRDERSVYRRAHVRHMDNGVLKEWLSKTSRVGIASCCSCDGTFRLAPHRVAAGQNGYRQGHGTRAAAARSQMWKEAVH